MTLDEFGWGYCQFCNRQIMLDDDGRLFEHRLYFKLDDQCSGVGEEPTEPPAPDVEEFGFHAGPE